MSVTKSLRFAVLRRDNYTCRYCRSTTGELTVDHVVPVAHGGTDDPTNLVAACFDCNAGKAAGPAELAEGPDDAMLEASRRQLAAAEERLELDRRIQQAHRARWDIWYANVEVFLGTWAFHFPYQPQPKTEWLIDHFEAGISPARMSDNVELAHQRAGGGTPGARYFYGICRNQLADAQGVTA